VSLRHPGRGFRQTAHKHPRSGLRCRTSAPRDKGRSVEQEPFASLGRHRRETCARQFKPLAPHARRTGAVAVKDDHAKRQRIIMEPRTNKSSNFPHSRDPHQAHDRYVPGNKDSTVPKRLNRQRNRQSQPRAPVPLSRLSANLSNTCKNQLMHQDST